MKRANPSIGHIRAGLFGVVGVGLLMICPPIGGAVSGQPTAGPRFSLVDQFGDSLSQDDLAGRVTVLIGGTRSAGKESRELAVEVQGLIESRLDLRNMVQVLRVADLRGIPKVLEPAVTATLSKKYRQGVLMDWQGHLTGAYDFAPKRANLVVIGRDGGLVYRVSEGDTRTKVLDELRAVLSRVGTEAADACSDACGSAGAEL